MQHRKALGKGLASLIPEERIQTTSDNEKGVAMVEVENIVPNRLQPRRNFSDESLRELADSIKTNGIVQPLIVTPEISGRYELIAGERRLRAAKLAGLEKVPVIIREANSETMLELAVIENVQREDLNPIDEGLAYKELMEEFGYRQEDVAEKVSKSRSHVANALRLLYLPKVIQEDVVLNRLSPGHARALLAISDLQEQLRIREEILHSRLTVRDVERLIQEKIKGERKEKKRSKKKNELTSQMKSVEDEITRALGTKVRINPHGNNKGGKIVIDYYSVQDLNRVYEKIISN